MSLFQCRHEMLRISLIGMLLACSWLVPASAAETSDVLTPDREFEGGKRFHTGDDTIIVLQLNGTWQEMGRQYGNLLREEIPKLWPVTVQPLLDKKETTEKEALELFGRRVHETSSL